MGDQSSAARREPESVVALATPCPGVLRPARNGPAQSGRIGLRVRLRPAGPGRCVLHVAHSRGSGSAPGNFPRASSISPPTQSNPADPCRIRSIPGEREIRRKARKSSRFSPNPPRSPGRKIEFHSRRLHCNSGPFRRENVFGPAGVRTCTPGGPKNVLATKNPRSCPPRCGLGGLVQMLVCGWQTNRQRPAAASPVLRRGDRV
jgi:hypothetical protein